MNKETPAIAVVIPCHRVRDKILGVLGHIPPQVSRIFCIDDACPEKSGAHIKQHINDPRVTVIFHEENQGVGGAMITGYKAALAENAGIIVKIDGDGQMDPKLLSRFTSPIVKGLCDYAKGNRFFSPEDVRAMPRGRLVGNGILSFLTKLSSGYWSVFDPTNGYTAIHAGVLRQLPLDKISRDYFYESDMLFRLNIMRAVVADVPMTALYEDEQSGISVKRIVWPFVRGHVRNFLKRVTYNYFLRDFQLASLQLVFGLLFLVFGLCFGVVKWHVTGAPASAGTVMLSALPIILGFQMILSFLQFDIQSVPRLPLQASLENT